MVVSVILVYSGNVKGISLFVRNDNFC